jgi:hypothetical protein
VSGECKVGEGLRCRLESRGETEGSEYGLQAKSRADGWCGSADQDHAMAHGQARRVQRQRQRQAWPCAALQRAHRQPRPCPWRSGGSTLGPCRRACARSRGRSLRERRGSERRAQGRGRRGRDVESAAAQSAALKACRSSAHWASARCSRCNTVAQARRLLHVPAGYTCPRPPAAANPLAAAGPSPTAALPPSGAAPTAGAVLLVERPAALAGGAGEHRILWVAVFIDGGVLPAEGAAFLEVRIVGAAALDLGGRGAQGRLVGAPGGRRGSGGAARGRAGAAAGGARRGEGGLGARGCLAASLTEEGPCSKLGRWRGVRRHKHPPVTLGHAAPLPARGPGQPSCHLTRPTYLSEARHIREPPQVALAVADNEGVCDRR